MHECDERTRTILRRLKRFKKIFTAAQRPPCALECDEKIRIRKKRIQPVARRQLPDFWAFFVVTNVLKMHTWCLKNEYVGRGRGKWAWHVSYGRIFLASRISRKRQEVSALVVSIGYRKIWVPKNVLTNLVIGRSAPPPNSDTFRSACLLFFISVFTLSNVSYLEVSRQNHRILHVSWQNWTAKQCSELINVAAKKLTETTYHLPCLVPYLVQLVNELDTTWVIY